LAAPPNCRGVRLILVSLAADAGSKTAVRIGPSREHCKQPSVCYGNDSGNAGSNAKVKCMSNFSALDNACARTSFTDGDTVAFEGFSHLVPFAAATRSSGRAGATSPWSAWFRHNLAIR